MPEPGTEPVIRRQGVQHIGHLPSEVVAYACFNGTMCYICEDGTAWRVVDGELQEIQYAGF